jgi:mannobiose 2-epimerase
MTDGFHPSAFETELRGNILPFWMNQTPDRENGGFYGAITNDLQVDNAIERSAVVYARIMWTFSTAYRVYCEDRYLDVARRAYNYLTRYFWDVDYGGMYWSLDYHGKPVNDRKHTYAQAFSIYGLVEFYRTTGEIECLHLAQELFHLVEQHTSDSEYGGNLECRNRQWDTLEDMRLSTKEVNCAKSMNTLLHLIEAYTNLMRVWDDPELKSKQQALIRSFIDHIVEPQTHHLKLFFDRDWRSLSREVSYGHDIEASWLLVEAAEVLGEPNLLAETRRIAVEMAQAVYAEGCNADGSLLYERTPLEIKDDRHWWVQAEAVVGFYNAYQLSGQDTFARAAAESWQYIQSHLIDRQHGDWFKVLDNHNVPYPTQYKVGPWECPYHHSRMCFELIYRLSPP